MGGHPIMNFGRLVITRKEIVLTGGNQLKKKNKEKAKAKKKRKKIKYFKLIWKALVINHTHLTYLMHITHS